MRWLANNWKYVPGVAMEVLAVGVEGLGLSRAVSISLVIIGILLLAWAGAQHRKEKKKVPPYPVSPVPGSARGEVHSRWSDLTDDQRDFVTGVAADVLARHGCWDLWAIIEDMATGQCVTRGNCGECGRPRTGVGRPKCGSRLAYYGIVF